MFESSPQSKIAIAYLLSVPSGEQIAVVVVYSVSTNNMLRILRCDAEVTQMCTPGDDSLFIVGTALGSIYLYELNEFDSSQPRAEELDYEGLMRSFYPSESANAESDQYFDKLQQLRSRYAIQWPTF